jgi:hypothetical protein
MWIPACNYNCVVTGSGQERHMLRENRRKDRVKTHAFRNLDSLSTDFVAVGGGKDQRICLQACAERVRLDVSRRYQTVYFLFTTEDSF